MSDALHAFHFLRPWWLLGLVLLPVLPWLLRRAGSSAMLARLADPQLLPHLLEGSEVRRAGPMAAVLLGWTLACLAIAGPTWERLAQPVYTAQRAQVVVVSLSRRMLASDLKPDRMTRVRYKIHALLDANKAGQNALVAYAGAAFTVAPLTSDAGALTDLLDALSPDTMPVDGDDAAAGIRRATRLLTDAGESQGSIVVIDDHADHQATTAASAARAAGLRVSVMGVGTGKGAPVPKDSGGFEHGPDGKVLLAARDDASLRAVAAAGGGRYVRMQPDASDIDALKSELRTRAGVQDRHQQVRAWRDRGPWLLLLLLPLLALGFRRGALMTLALLVLLPFASAPAHAGGWQDAWHTRDQEAARALANGHPKLAQRLARDPALRGTAAYRAGDYKDAAHAFAQAPGAQNLYNLGNALAGMHRYKDAIRAYDRALQADPKLADARANRKAIRDWLRRQQAQKHGGQGQDHRGGQNQGSSSGSASSSPGGHGQKGTRDKHPKPSGEPRGKDEQAAGKPSSNRDQKPSGDIPGGARPGQDEAGATPQSRADRSAQAKAREALKKRMDAALAHAASARKPYVLGARKDDSPGQGKRLPASMREALRQVPDDPGGLLRRKFMLEYQRRMQRGNADEGNGDGER